MGQGYTRNDTSNNIADGNVINASDLDGEFNAVDAAFNESSGHTHDGTADEGAPVTVLGPVQDFVASATEIKPKTNNTLDIGTTSLQFKDMYLDGTAYIDGLGEDILVATDKKVQFRDTALFINSSTDGQLDIAADTEVEITTALVEISADATVGDDLTLKSDAAVLGFGADTDVTLTHVADTGLLVNAAMVVQFRDSAINIGSPADGDLDINADDEIELNSTLIDINGNVEISGTLSQTGIATFTDDIIIGDGKTIGSASDVDAITIASNGQLTLTQQLNGAAGTFSGILKTDDATEATSTTDGSLQTDGGLSVVKDAVFGDDIKLLSDSAVIHFGADSDITLTHAADTSLATNGVMIATTFEPTGDTAAGDNAAIGYTAAEGLILTGQGSTSDITLKNDADATVCFVPTGTDDLRFPDSAVLQFGADADLTINHDGSNSFITDAGTGALYIQGTSGVFIRSADGGENLAAFTDDGAATLYHNNAAKLATTSTGVDVTGTVTADDLDLSVGTAGDGIQVTSTGANYLNLGFDTNRTGASQTLTQIEQKWNGTAVARISFVTGADTTNKDDAEIRFQTASAGTPATRMTIDNSGNLIINDTITGVPTALAAAKVHIDRASETGHGIIVENILENYVGLAQKRVGTAGVAYALYLINNGNQEVGTISFSNTGTAYNTTSDYRLKTAVTYDWDATSRIKQLKPARFEWIADGDDAVPVDGFLAHEAATVVPESVIGTHNEVKTWTQQEIDDGDAPDGSSAGDNKLDEDGNTIPVMQGIDQSKLVPLLTKALIEAVEKIEALEARITALEA
jgi:hypothetical protein